jgi:hypothetical protein
MDNIFMHMLDIKGAESGQMSLDNRTLRACKSSEAEHERAAKIVTEVEETLKRSRGL